MRRLRESKRQASAPTAGGGGSSSAPSAPAASAQGIADAGRDDDVGRRGADDGDALNEHAPEFRDAEQHEPVVDGCENNGPEPRADDVSRPAGDADPADDRRGERGELPARSEDNGHGSHAGGVQKTG